jgi:hypothetical protein
MFVKNFDRIYQNISALQIVPWHRFFGLRPPTFRLKKFGPPPPPSFLIDRPLPIIKYWSRTVWHGYDVPNHLI